MRVVSCIECEGGEEEVKVSPGMTRSAVQVCG